MLEIDHKDQKLKEQIYRGNLCLWITCKESCVDWMEITFDRFEWMNRWNRRKNRLDRFYRKCTLGKISKRYIRLEQKSSLFNCFLTEKIKSDQGNAVWIQREDDVSDLHQTWLTEEVHTKINGGTADITSLGEVSDVTDSAWSARTSSTKVRYHLSMIIIFTWKRRQDIL